MNDRATPTEPMTDRTLGSPADLDRLDLAKHTGLVPVVAQDADDGRVLMVAWATREALELSLSTGSMHFWSRSRSALWKKGETSGNTLTVVSLHTDCDGDTVLARVRPAGPACHTGEATCFGRIGSPDGTAAFVDLPEDAGFPNPAGSAVDTPAGSAAGTPAGSAVDTPAGSAVDAPAGLAPAADLSILAALDATLAARQANRPADSYTVRLLDDENLRLKKLGEETAELVAALAKGDGERIPEEAADLLYHLLVALRGSGVGLRDVMARLEARRK